MQIVQRWRKVRGEVVAIEHRKGGPLSSGGEAVSEAAPAQSGDLRPVMVAAVEPVEVWVPIDLDVQRTDARLLANVLVDVDDDDDDDDDPIEVTAVAPDDGQVGEYLRYTVSLDRDAPRLRRGADVIVKIPLETNDQPQRVVSYASVIYDTSGSTWVYSNPEPLVFLRVPVNIDFIQGDLAVLKDGPEVGTTIVKTGAMELLGAETKFGK
jgi:hypothetical protein